jgi:thiamine-phosphate pyrophosphorylase
VNEVEWSFEVGVDYLGVGPVYGTSSKDDAGDAVGIERMREVRRLTDGPFVGIGGINAGNAAPVIEAGANGVAVISSVVAQADIEAAARSLRDVVDDARNRARS